MRLIVSVQLANNETGVIQPLASIADIVHRYQGLVHTDAVQAVGKIPVSIWGLGVDALTLSAHKLGGPQGVGALVLAAGDLETGDKLIRGGGQERGARSGTENVAGIVGFGVASQVCNDEQAREHDRLLSLRDQCEAHIRRITPEAIILGSEATRLPNTICFAVDALKAETALMSFDLAGVQPVRRAKLSAPMCLKQ
jgi:cysteine desulfurase